MGMKLEKALTEIQEASELYRAWADSAYVYKEGLPEDQYLTYLLFSGHLANIYEDLCNTPHRWWEPVVIPSLASFKKEHLRKYEMPSYSLERPRVIRELLKDSEEAVHTPEVTKEEMLAGKRSEDSPYSRVPQTRWENLPETLKDVYVALPGRNGKTEYVQATSAELKEASGYQRSSGYIIKVKDRGTFRIATQYGVNMFSEGDIRALLLGEELDILTRTSRGNYGEATLRFDTNARYAVATPYIGVLDQGYRKHESHVMPTKWSKAPEDYPCV